MSCLEIAIRSAKGFFQFLWKCYCSWEDIEIVVNKVSTIMKDMNYTYQAYFVQLATALQKFREQSG